MNDKLPPSRSDPCTQQVRSIRVRDFLDDDGVAVASPDEQLLPDDILVHGNFLHAELRPGLLLHFSDVTEERPFTATSTLPEGLSCIFFLNGNVDLTLGERDFHFAGHQKAAITGTAIMNTRPEWFQRTSKRRQHLRHIVVSASPEWLDLDGMGNVRSAAHGKRLLNDHLGDHQWVLTPRTLELLKQILQPSHLAPPLHSLFLEGRAVEIVAESLAAALEAEPQLNKSLLLTRSDRIKLQRAVDLIRDNLGETLSVDQIARGAGVSASGLQRLFRASEGQSVFEYVRQQRLDRAHLLLEKNEVTIQEASEVAGYSNAANFSTAFRRRFGMSPKEVARAWVSIKTD